MQASMLCHDDDMASFMPMPHILRVWEAILLHVYKRPCTPGAEGCCYERMEGTEQTGSGRITLSITIEVCKAYDRATSACFEVQGNFGQVPFCASTERKSVQ